MKKLSFLLGLTCFLLVAAYNINQTTLNVGDGTDADVTIQARNADATPPAIKYDASSNAWQAANDGSTFFNIGAASSTGALYSAKSASYVITDSDQIRTVGMTTGASNYDVTLPTAADNTDRIVTVKKIDSGAGIVTLLGEAAGETIDGVSGTTGIDINNQYEEVTVQCDGSVWHILSGAIAKDGIAGLIEYNYEELDISSSGDFDASQPVLRITRSGSTCTISWNQLAHDSDTSASSASDFIPTYCQPTHSIRNVIYISASGSMMLTITTSGIFRFNYYNWSGSGLSSSTSGEGTASWVVDE